MKKITVLLCLCVICTTLPVFADANADLKLQKQQQKYQLKMEKLKQKQELECIKHPEKCTTSAVKETNLTLGTAQKNIKIGTSQDEVAMALGSPNIITVDSEGKDTWIYDKVASVTSYNANGFNIGGALGGIGGGAGSSGFGGGVGGFKVGHSSSGGNIQSNQKTLTIVIKFTNNKVSSFKYHMSSF